MRTPFEQQIANGIARRIAKGIAIAIAATIAITIFIFLGGKVVQLLWNWLLPPLFDFPTITFWQALGLLLLCRILFGSFGSSGRVRRKMEDSMKPEDRERFRQRIRERFDLGPTPSGEGGQT